MPSALSLKNNKCIFFSLTTISLTAKHLSCYQTIITACLERKGLHSPESAQGQEAGNSHCCDQPHMHSPYASLEQSKRTGKLSEAEKYLFRGCLGHL
jgi:hypothetical protein